VRIAIEMFTGYKVRAKWVQLLINSPQNVINLEHNAHLSMVQSLAWGIEATPVTNRLNDEVRVIRLCAGAGPTSNITLIVEIQVPCR
jgi:hypothetical protein